MIEDNKNNHSSILITGTTFNKEDQEFLNRIGVIYKDNAFMENCVLNDIQNLDGFKSVMYCKFNYSKFDQGTILDILGVQIITPYDIKTNQIDMFDEGNDPADWWKRS